MVGFGVSPSRVAPMNIGSVHENAPLFICEIRPDGDSGQQRRARFILLWRIPVLIAGAFVFANDVIENPEHAAHRFVWKVFVEDCSTSVGLNFSSAVILIHRITLRTASLAALAKEHASRKPSLIC
jgi:hypothetical protein